MEPEDGFYTADGVNAKPRGALASTVDRSLDAVRAAAVRASRAPVPFANTTKDEDPSAVSLLSSDSEDRTDALMQSTAMRGVGGGLVGSALGLEGGGWRHKKISRYWRLRRGTRCFRFTLLALSVLIIASGYFSYDTPSITAASLEADLGIDNEKLGLLFSVYALPNAIMPMLSGAFFSRVGKWLGVVIIASVITLGICITGLGVFVRSYPVMVLGRAIYGCGGESVFVGIEILVTKWFKGAEIGLAYGVVQAMGQAGSFGAFYGAPPLLAAFGDVKYVYATCMMVTGAALLALMAARILEKTAYILKPSDAAPPPSAPMGDGGDMHHSTGVMLSSSGAMAAAVLDGIEQRKHRDARARRGSAEGATAPSENPSVGETNALISADKVEMEDDEIVVEKFNDFDDVDEQLDEELQKYSPCPNIWFLNYIWTLLGLSHLRRLKWDFWCVLASIACYSSAFYTFLAFGNVWLQQVHGYSDAQAGQTVGIVSIFSVAVSPTVGIIMDKRGGQRYAAFAAMCGACFWFGLMGFSPAPPVVTVLFAGACYAVLPSALYPLLVETVPDSAFTSVYAMVNSSINIVLTAAFYFAGWISNVQVENNVGAASPFALPLKAGRVGNASAGGDGKGFDAVFAMFCCITGVGILTTGALARQQWLGHVSYRPVGHGHGH